MLANTTPSLITPLYNTQGSIALNVDAPFIINNDKLDLDLATTLSTFGVPIGKLFVNENNKLDINLDGILYAGNGISKLGYLDQMLDLGLSYIPGTGDIVPKAAIDTENLDFKSGNISIKSLGQSRVPYYNAVKLTSQSSFLFDDASNQLSVNKIILNDTVDENSDNNRATSKQYTDGLHTYASDRPLTYTQGPTRIWDIKLNETFLNVDSGGNLITTITGVDEKCISVTPENKILLSYNNKHFGETTAVVYIAS